MCRLTRKCSTHRASTALPEPKLYMTTDLEGRLDPRDLVLDEIRDDSSLPTIPFAPVGASAALNLILDDGTDVKHACRLIGISFVNDGVDCTLDGFTQVTTRSLVAVWASRSLQKAIVSVDNVVVLEADQQLEASFRFDGLDDSCSVHLSSKNKHAS